MAVGVEGDAEPLEVAEARGRLLDQDARRGGADDPAAGGDGVLEMLLRRVVGGERGREPALGPVRRGLGQRARGDQRDPGALARGGQRGEEPGRAGAHDDEVGPVHGEERRTVSACRRTVWLRHPARSPTRSTATRSGRSGSSRSRRRWSAHDWFGCDVVAAPRRDARRSCRPCTRLSISTTSRSCAPRGGGPIDDDTVAVAARTRRRCGRRAALSRWSTRCLSGAARDGRVGHAPARAPRRAGAGDGVLLLRQRRRWRRGRRAPRTGVERVLILDWDVHHGNGTNAIFHADPGVLFVSIHEWPLYPGTGPASDVGSGDGEGYTVNLPVPGGSGDGPTARWSTTWCAPLSRAWEPGLVLVSAGFDAHRADPLATCRVSEAGLRGDDGVAAAGVRFGRRAARAGAGGRVLARGARRGRWRR